MGVAIGVDIGGTKISVTLGNSRGKILAKKLIPTPTGRKTRRGIEHLADSLAELKRRSRKKILGIGVGIPGPIDPRKGIVQRSPHMGGWGGIPLKAFLEKRLKLPVFITNDANAAALGEKVFGQGRGAQNFVYVTVSTGIGSGVILNGKLFLGASFGAGEVGHTIIFPDGEKCGCGQRGCLEAYASGTAIARFAQEQIRRGRKSRIGKWVRPSRRITGEIVALAAEERDVLALEAFRRAGYFLGIGLANVINLLNPEMLILGGSVFKSSRFFWPSMSESTRRHAWPSLYRACRIVRTRLGDRVGDLGALALVFSRNLTIHS